MTSSSKLSKKRNRSYQDQYLDHQKQESQYNEMKGEHNILISGLDPNKYKEVKSNKTYLWINGEHRVKDVVRVSEPIKSKYATKDYFDETIELDAVTDEKMTVRFSRSKLGKGTAVRRKYPREQPTIFLSGSIMLKSNFEIKKLELLDKHMKPVRNKKYQCVLYDDTTEHHSVIYQSSQVSKKPRVSPGLGHSLSKAVKREKWELFDEEGNSKMNRSQYYHVSGRHKNSIQAARNRKSTPRTAEHSPESVGTLMQTEDSQMVHKKYQCEVLSHNVFVRDPLVE